MTTAALEGAKGRAAGDEAPTEKRPIEPTSPSSFLSGGEHSQTQLVHQLDVGGGAIPLEVALDDVECFARLLQLQRRLLCLLAVGALHRFEGFAKGTLGGRLVVALLAPALVA